MKSMILTLVLIASSFVQAQTATPVGAVKLQWNANSETNLVKYYVYVGTSPGQYSRVASAGLPTVTNGVVQYSIANLIKGVRYYFAVTAINKENLESPKSNEVSYVLPLPTPAAAPLTLKASE